MIPAAVFTSVFHSLPQKLFFGYVGGPLSSRLTPYRISYYTLIIIYLLNIHEHHIWQKVFAKFWLIKAYGQSLWDPWQGANKCLEIYAEPWPGGGGRKEVILSPTIKIFCRQQVPSERCEVMN